MRLINFRPFLAVFALTATGILFAPVAVYFPPLGIALIACLIVGTGAWLTVSALRGRPVKAVTAGIALAAVAATCAAFFFILDARPAFEENRTYEVTGRVTEHYAYDGLGRTYAASLDSLVIDGEPTDGVIDLTVSEADIAFAEVGCGYTLSFSSELLAAELVGEGGVNASAARSGLIARAYADTAEVEPGVPEAMETVRLNLRSHLFSAMGDDAGAVAYGMIAGDRYLLDDEISDSFSRTGIGHILSVSGIHVGLMAMIAARLLSMLPLPKAVGRGFTTLLLAAYTVFTGGSPSAVRALIMCAVALWAPMFGRNDPLNSLMLAATVCLCVSPFYLFECGYLLSVSAVLGLVLFSDGIKKFLVRLKMPDKAAGGLASSTAVQLTIAPATAAFFSRFYIWSLPVNAVMMGALGLVFTLLVACLPFSLLLPVLLAPCGWLITALVGVCKFVSALPLAAVTLHVSALAFVIPVLMFFASRFVMWPHRKFAVLAVALSICAVAAGSENGLHETNALLAVGGSGTLTVVYDGGDRYLLGDLTDGGRAAAALDRARCCDEGFIVYTTDLGKETALGILDFHDEKRVTEVRFALGGDMSGIRTLVGAGIPVTGVEYTDGVFDVAQTSGRVTGWMYARSGRAAYISAEGEPTGVEAAADVIRCRYDDDPASGPVYLTSYGTGGTTVTDYYSSYLYDFSSGTLRRV